MNVNPETTVHNNMYNVNLQWSDTLHELVLCKQVKQVRFSYAIIKFTHFVDFMPF